jgi:hypothetical protein
MSPTRGPFHFLHIGKTGGTAIKHAISASGRGDILLHGHGVKLKHVPEGERAFFFVRDPVSRFVSGFNSRMRKGQPRRNNEWKPEEAIAFSRFQSPNALAIALSSTDGAEQQAAIAAMGAINHIRFSLWHWLGTPDALHRRREDILFIGQQECLDEDVSVLAHRLGFSHLKLPDGDVAAHRVPPHMDQTLTSVAITNLRRWYAADYSAIAQCRDIALQKQFGGSLGKTGQVLPLP